MKKGFIIAGIILVVIVGLYISKPSHKNTGFDVFDSIADNIVSGGVPKDGIPPIDDPIYVSRDAATFLSDDDVVFGWIDNGQPKAFPKSIMYWHEIVNDGDTSITYCPLTASVLAFTGFNLGVSGGLYNSNLVMYDRATDSEIPQILGTGVTGPLKGKQLPQDKVVQTSWGRWKALYPETLVLSNQQGIYDSSKYERTPYPGYDTLLRLWFPVAAKSDLYPTKQLVTGVLVGDTPVAVLKEKLKEVGETSRVINNQEVRFVYDPDLDIIRIFGSEELPSTEVYWFAWYAYYPDTLVIN